jgi:hypothetical protein
MSSGLITGVTPGGYYVIEIQATNAVGSGCPVWLSSGTPPYAMAEADPPTYKPGIWGPSGARPASASEPNHTGYQDVFWRAGNGDIYEMWYRGSSNSWNGPVDLTTTLWNNCNGKEFPKSTSAIQVAIADNGHEYVFWRGTDGNIWEAWSGSGNCNGTTWSLKDFGNGYETWSSVSIAVTPNGQEEDIFYAGGPTGSSGHDIFEAWYRNGHWNGPVNMSTKRNFPTTTSAVNVAMSSQGYEYVFWRYTEYEAYTLGDGWNFKYFGSGYMTWSQVSVTVNSYNDIQTISYEGGNGDVYTTYYLPYYGWTSPQDMTQGFSLPKTDAGPSITINPNGVFYFYARARNGTIFEYWPEGTELFSWRPGPTMGVGVYVDTASGVNDVLNDHWTGPGTVSGFCGTYIEDVQDGYACAQMVTPSGNVTCPGNGQISYTIDQYTECDLAHFNYNDFWLSFWTIGGPTSAANCDSSSHPWYCAGYAAGYNAAGEMLWAAEHDTQGQAGAFLPSYAVLDPEGWNMSGFDTSTFQSLIKGWGEGIRSATLLIQPAYYDSQSPISGVLDSGPPPYALFPGVEVSNGYSLYPSIQSSPAVAGYQAIEKAAVTCSNAVRTVGGWGKAYNFVQFNPSGYNPPSEVPCGP